MAKLDATLRAKVIDMLSNHEAEGWADMDFSDFAEIISEGYKGYKDYTDEELYESLTQYVDFEDEEDNKWITTAREMEAQLAIETMLEDKS